MDSLVGKFGGDVESWDDVSGDPLDVQFLSRGLRCGDGVVSPSWAFAPRSYRSVLRGRVAERSFQVDGCIGYE